MALISSTTCCAGVASAPVPSRETPTSLTTTSAPCRANSRASSRPMPRPAPVTMTTRPSHKLMAQSCRSICHPPSGGSRWGHFGPPFTRRGDEPALDVCRAVLMPEPGPFVSGFAAWLDSGHGITAARPRHVGHAREFLAWYDVNHCDDVVAAARSFVACGSHQQAASMRLLLEWMAGDGQAVLAG